MTYFKRHIDDKLLEWKNDARRKPLLIRGARQVGKSTAVRELGKQFRHFAEVNLEKHPDLRQLFTENINVKTTSSTIKIPARMSRTVFCAPKPISAPKIPAPVINFETSIPKCCKIANISNSSFLRNIKFVKIFAEREPCLRIGGGGRTITN